MIVIKSFTKLPDNCADCSLNYDFCSCSADYNISFDINDDLGSGRRENCPLVEVEAQPKPFWGYHASAGRPLGDNEIISRLRDIQKQIGGSYAIDRAVEVIEAIAERRTDEPDKQTD